MKTNRYYKTLSLMIFAVGLLSSQDSMAGKRTDQKIDEARRNVIIAKKKVRKENNPIKKQEYKKELKDQQDVRDQLKAKKRENRNNALNNTATGVGIVVGLASLFGL